MNGTFLLLCDTLSTRQAFTEALHHEGRDWTVHMVPTLAAAREILAKVPVDGVICDNWLPDGDGLEFVRFVGSRAEYSHIQTYLLSQAEDRVLRRQALEAGVSDFLTKPIHSEEVVLRLEMALKLHAAAKASPQLVLSAPEIDLNFIKESRLEVVWRLSKASECRDQETGNHTLRVGYYALAIARELNLDEEFQEQILLASMLHDIGKLGISDSILRKSGKLTEHEMAVIKTHCEIGHTILKAQYRPPKCDELGVGFGEIRRSPFIDLAADIALQHHEKWDGTGYPYQLKGEEINLAARITAVADVFDVLRSSRPYKPAFGEDKAINQIQADGGTHFDPKVVEAFVHAMPVIRKISHELMDGDDVLRRLAA